MLRRSGRALDGPYPSEPFDPLGMINAHPSKSKRFLLEGYRDTDRALRLREPRSGRVKGVVPDAE